MAVFISGDSFTLEHKGKLGSKHYESLIYKLPCSPLTPEEGSYHFKLENFILEN